MRVIPAGEVQHGQERMFAHCNGHRDIGTLYPHVAAKTQQHFVHADLAGVGTHGAWHKCTVGLCNDFGAGAQVASSLS